MAVRCSTKTEAADLVRHCLEFGKIIIGKHCKDELANEDFDVLDARNVLRKGNILWSLSTTFGLVIGSTA